MTAIREEDLFDQSWRLNNLYYIKTKDAGKIVRFEMNWAQQEMFESVWYNNLVLKARQIGSTTFWSLLALDNALFNPNYNSVIIACDQPTAEIIFDNNIRTPYEELPDSLKQAISAEKNSTRSLSFPHHSGVSVATSARGGTVHFLLVSEFGKMCAKYPLKAKEVVSGSLESVGKGNITVIESTAEGSAGYFYQYCMDSQDKALKCEKLTSQDYRFHFFHWHECPDYQLNDTETLQTLVTKEDNEYFAKIEKATGRKITPNQRAWYVQKKQRLGDMMKQEYPSTYDEAFESSVEGAYYAYEMRTATEQGRLCRIPIEPTIPVNTFWDLGRNDTTVIWFHQHIGQEHRFIDYYENNGYGLDHYIRYLQGKKYVWGQHYLPHDVEITELTTNRSRKETLEAGGISPIVTVPRISNIYEGIEATRQALPRCWFDTERCDYGIKALKNYRREWDEQRSCHREVPMHDWASHPADAFRQFAQGYEPPSSTIEIPRQRVMVY